MSAALTAIANVPASDRFQIVIPDEGYLGITHSPDIVMIQVTWVGGRSTEVRKQFYRRVADAIHERAGIRREDVWISLVDTARERLVVRWRRHAIRSGLVAAEPCSAA